jgi:hypothetical protein
MVEIHLIPYTLRVLLMFPLVTIKVAGTTDYLAV